MRSDGSAPVVDIVPSIELQDVRAHAHRLLREHASCETVEIWRGGFLLQRMTR